MPGLRNLTPCLLIAAIAMTIGCASEDDDLVGTGKPRPTPSSTRSPANSNVVGGSLKTDQSAPTANLVLIEPDLDTLSLNAPAADGTAPAGFEDLKVLTARVLLTDGANDPQGVTWSSSNPQHVSAIAGVVKVLPGASSDAIVTATSVSDPNKTDSLIVRVTTDGELALTVLPTLAPKDADEQPTTLRIIRNGIPLPDQSLTNTLNPRLPAGTYTFEVIRIQPDGPNLNWSATNVQITPNGITPLQGTLQ